MLEVATKPKILPRYFPLYKTLENGVSKYLKAIQCVLLNFIF